MNAALLIFLPIIWPLCAQIAIDLYSFITGANQVAELLLIQLSALYKSIP